MSHPWKTAEKRKGKEAFLAQIFKLGSWRGVKFGARILQLRKECSFQAFSRLILF